jgi:general secretion pathway protein D
VKLRTAAALVLISLMTFVASLSVAQTRTRPGQLIPGIVRPNNTLPPMSQFTQGAAGTSGTPGAPGTPGTPGVAGQPNLREFDAGIDYQPLPAAARITFNLADADLPDLVRAIGNITGRRFIISGKARSIKATIYSPTKVSPAEAYQAFLSVLQTNGMTVVPSGRYLKIEDSAGVVTQPVPLGTGAEATPSEDRFFTRIHRLRNMTAEDAAQLLGHFKSQAGDITPYAATSTIVITDTGTNIRRMMSILAEVDVPSAGEQIWVERLHYASATEVVQRVNEVLGTTGATATAARPGSDVRLARLVAEERSNSVMVVATERMYHRVLELIRVLDRPNAQEGGNVHVYAVQHADAEELVNTVNNIVSGGRQAGQAAGQRGASTVFEGTIRITADKRTNSLVVTSTERDYFEVRNIVERLDRSRRQVFIEAAVMELEVTSSNQFGVSFHGGSALTNFLGIPGSTLPLGGFQAQNSIAFPASQDVLTGLALGVRGPAIPNLNLPIPGVTLGIPAFGVVLRALAESGDADVLATPSIIATDNESADINVGANIALQNNVGGGLAGLAGAAGGQAGALGLLGGLGGFAAPRGDVGTKIRVTPHVNDSNEVRLDIDQEISEAGAADGALGVVPINRRTAKTKVVVQDQQTVVIGGLIRNSVRRSNTRIPILGDLPLIGALFRTETRRIERRNLLLFMTPYVIRDQSDLRRIFERKMRERQEFLDRYFVLSGNAEVRPDIDYTRTNGLVEEIRQAIRQQREQQEREALSLERAPPSHRPSAPLELTLPPPGSSGGSTGTGPTMGTPTAPTAPTADAAPGGTGSGSVAPTPILNVAPTAMPIQLPLLTRPASQAAPQ